MNINYSLYLVTGRELIPHGQDFFQTIEQSINGGVTVVQIREKASDTGEFLDIAIRAKEICRRYGVPIIINDRIDIALAVEADGVHLGQTDMPVPVARKLLPANILIGISCNSSKEAEQAVKDGADYIGIGAIWSTQTKQLTNPTVGVRGVGAILEKLQGTSVKAVAIGGINSNNILRTLHGSVSPAGRKLDGVAVVSDIMASTTPLESARSLAEAIVGFHSIGSLAFSSGPCPKDVLSFVRESAGLLAKIRETVPVIHQITNNVVINQSANATLALGASPIMATSPVEMEDLSKFTGALLVNFGTINDKEGMLVAGRCANTTRKPIVFDPVGVGATTYRRQVANELLNAWQATVIKGNPGEIGALANSIEVQSRGVDSVGKGFADPVAVVRSLALKERCIVAMTGEVDWVSDGVSTIKITNGHPLLADITGSGCMVGTSVATFCAAANLSASQGASPARLVRGNMLSATVAGILAINIASEFAATRAEVKGTGTFLPALIDELYNLTEEKLVQKARIEIL